MCISVSQLVRNIGTAVFARLRHLNVIAGKLEPLLFVIIFARQRQWSEHTRVSNNKHGQIKWPAFTTAAFVRWWLPAFYKGQCQLGAYIQSWCWADTMSIHGVELTPWTFMVLSWHHEHSGRWALLFWHERLQRPLKFLLYCIEVNNINKLISIWISERLA